MGGKKLFPDQILAFKLILSSFKQPGKKVGGLRAILKANSKSSAKK